MHMKKMHAANENKCKVVLGLLDVAEPCMARLDG